MRTPLIAGNWKMNGSNESLRKLIDQISLGRRRVTKAEMAVMAPYPYLRLCQELLGDSDVAWGSQDISRHVSGAYTGEVSGGMLQDFHCRYVLVGHSERRMYHKESSLEVAEKLARALALGMKPILCVGESLEQRQNGESEQVVQEQLAEALAFEDNLSGWGQVVIAYEPVWAIGTGVTATPEQAQQIHAQIRQQLAEQSQRLADDCRILYGGSMKPENAQSLLDQEDIDGGLIGGASLQAESFLQIGEACNNSY